MKANNSIKRETNETIGKENQKEDIEGVYKLFEDWKQAVYSKDIKRISSLVTEDAEFWTHEAQPLIDWKALELAFEPFLAKYDFSQNYTCYELIIRNDVAFIRGLELNYKTPIGGGEKIISRQRAFSVLHQSKDSIWRFARGMTNLPDKNINQKK